MAWDRLTDGPTRRLVEVAERFADGLADDEELVSVWNAVLLAQQPEPGPLRFVRRAAYRAGYRDATLAAERVAAEMQRFDETAGPYQCDLLRDIFGTPPFRAVVVKPAWLAWDGGVVVKLARAAYDERAFDRLPILAHALVDAGCADEELLGHLRRSGPHAAGCHVLDAVLGQR
jgi:hypothetical protein